MQKNTNAIKEFKSHSSWLYNDRLAVLLYLLDMDSIRLNSLPLSSNECPGLIRRVSSLNQQIYKNVRMVVRGDVVMRRYMNLNTKDPGVYITDIQQWLIIEAIRKCEEEQLWTPRRCKSIISELNNFEMSIKDILQYYSYFIRTGIKQKPDLLVATERYRGMADKMTLEQLRQVVGKSHKINFDDLEKDDTDTLQIEKDADDDNEDIEEDADDDDEDEDE